MKPVKNPILLALVLVVFFACKKDAFTGSASALLQTSVDTLHFDTVFTSAGSITQYIKINNENDKGIRISSVKLAGGAASPFKINVDGTPGPLVGNVDIPANDSVYIFVTVSINPNISGLAFLVQDSIEINYNGNRKYVQLDAFGQNAHFFRNRKITGAETWNNDLPYVILGRLTVDTTASLTINKGCRIYMHADAPFIVHGSLQVNGEKWDSTRVVFAGDRLDEPYRDFPASYPGLIFTDASKNNVLNYAIIKNAYDGIFITEPAAGTKLTLNETIIQNAYNTGITAIHTSIAARNLLVSNCGHNIIIAKGGNYDFTHCTIVAFSNNYLQHKDPCLILTNVISQNNVPVAFPLTATFTNCIIWGEENGFVPNEVGFIRNDQAGYSVAFNQVLWRMQTPPAITGVVVTGAKNQPPQFEMVNNGQKLYDFRLKDDSPAKNAGIATPVNLDLDGAPRPVGLPDLGAYEKQ